MRGRLRYKLLISGIAFISVLFTACLPQKQVVYFQKHGDSASAVAFDTTFVTVIHPNDILNIFVTSVNAEASKYFNFSDRPEMMGGNSASPGANGYLVDAYGFIQLPLIGSVRVGGLTSSAARDTVIRRLEKYIETPTVKLNIQNFKVTVLGEVLKPGIYYVSSEKMTLTDVISLAGDLTVFGKRNNIMVIREENGKKTFGSVDITTRDFFRSQYYNLHSNDIVYVEPLKGKKLQAESWYKLLPIVLSTISVAIVLIRIYQ